MSGTNCTTFNCLGSSGGGGLFKFEPSESINEQRRTLTIRGADAVSGALIVDAAASIRIDEMIVTTGAAPTDVDTLRFELRNESDEGLTTIVLSHKLTSISGDFVEIYQFVDLFAGRADIPARSASSQNIAARVRLAGPLASIETTVAYIETAGGARFGRAQEAMTPVLEQIRERDLAMFERIAKTLRSTPRETRASSLRLMLENEPQEGRCSNASAIASYLLSKGDLETLDRLVRNPRTLPQRR